MPLNKVNVMRTLYSTGYKMCNKVNGYYYVKDIITFNILCSVKQAQQRVEQEI